MRRKVLTVVGVVVVLLGVLVSPFLAAFVGNASPVDGTSLPGKAWLVLDGFAAAYVVPLEGGKVALVDCGVDADAKALKASLEAKGLSAEAVTFLLFTHAHRDHVGGAKAFPNATAVALKAEQPLFEGRPEHLSPLQHVAKDAPAPVLVQRWLGDGEAVDLGGTQARAFAIPGHTDGSAAWLVNGVLYLGDSAGLSSDGTLKAAPWVFSVDQAQNRASLVALWNRLVNEGLGVKKLAFGHTAPGEPAALEAFAAKR